MAGPRNIRRAALQAIYQLDARGEADLESVIDSADPDLAPADRKKAMELALAAFRRNADDETRRLAPEWPPHRQPAIDRAIIRLAHYEITSGRTPPRVAVSEAVELAREFSTERSPAFVNGVLDKVLKRIVAEGPAGTA